MEWRYVAEGLAKGLAEVLPSRVEVHVEAGGILLVDPSTPHARVLTSVEDIVNQPGEQQDYVEIVCWSVLSVAQDLMAEVTAEPWPGIGTQMPEPGVAIEEGEVRMWYGDRDSPGLRLASFPYRPNQD